MNSPNPFRYGNPITHPDHFYGRQSEVRQIVRGLRDGSTNSSIIGERKIGKTSLLYYLFSPANIDRLGFASNNHILVFFTFEGFGKISPLHFWRLLLDKIVVNPIVAKAEGLIALIKGKSTGDQILYQDVMDIFDAIRNRGIKTLIFLDEFDLVENNPNLDDDFFGALRNLAQHHAVGFVVSSRKRIKDLSHIKVGYSPFFNIFADVHLRPFNSEEANELIQRSLIGTSITFDSSDIEKTFEIAGYYPFFLQMACFFLFEAYSVRGLDGDAHRHDRLSFVRSKVAEQAESHFEYYWDHSVDEERILLTVLAILGQKNATQKGFSQHELDSVYEHSNHVTKSLLKRGLVTQTDIGYSLFSKIFQKWIADEWTSVPQSPPSFEDWITNYKKAPLAKVYERGKGVFSKLNPKYWDLLGKWLSNPNNQSHIVDFLKGLLQSP